MNQPNEPTKRKSLLLDNEVPKGYVHSDKKSNESTAPSSEATIFRHKTFGSEKYSSSHITEIFVNGGQLANFSQNQEFSLTFLELGTQPKVRFDIIKNEFEDGMMLKEQFNGLLEKIVRLKDNLEFVLNSKGAMLQVSNKKELKDKWEELKKELKKDENIQQIPPAQQAQMYAKGDSEFLPEYNLAADLRKSFFHASLFFPLYNTDWKKDAATPIANQFVMSSLFNAMRIPLRLSVSLSYDEETDEYLIKVDGNVDKSLLSRSLIEEAYKKEYPFLKGSFSKYSCDLFALYAIDAETHQLTYAEIELEERVNDNLLAKQNLDIEKIEEEPQNPEENE